MGMTITIVLTGIGIFSSWLITHKYYLKSLEDQRKEFQATAKEYIKIIEKFAEKEDSSSKINKKLLEEKRIDQCVEKYTVTGGGDFLKMMIETYDLPNEEKANLWDTTFLRAKGRKAKSNPFRDRDGKQA